MLLLIGIVVVIFGIGIIVLVLGIKTPPIHGIDNPGNILFSGNLAKIAGSILIILAIAICCFFDLASWSLLSWGLAVMGTILVDPYNVIINPVRINNDCGRHTHAKAKVRFWSGLVLLLVSLIIILVKMPVFQGGG